MHEFKYNAPSTLQSFFSLMDNHGESGCLLAGGTDVMIHMRFGKRFPSTVIDIKRITELNSDLTITKKGVYIGALTTLATVENSKFIKEKFPALSQAAKKVGSKQIRNRGTVIGNVCNASPAADTVAALLIYDAEINIVSKAGEKTVSIDEFIVGPSKTILKVGELVKDIFIPFPTENSNSCFLKLARREGADITIVGVATLVDSKENVRIALCAVGPTPFRAYIAEQILSKNLHNHEKVEMGIQAVVNAASPITDLRATREYRIAMIETLTKQALLQTLNDLPK